MLALCDKKDVIPGKFKPLLRTLFGEELSHNISLGKMDVKWHVVMEEWLDTDSTYCLRIEQSKGTKKGFTFAEHEYFSGYEKYRQTCKKANENYIVGLPLSITYLLHTDMIEKERESDRDRESGG